MQCVTVKKGVECAFMSKKGCTFAGGRCHTIVEQCQGCGKTMTSDEGTFCAIAPSPSKKWATGPCNFATHRQITVVEETQKLNPLKASKRAAGKKK